MVKEVALSKKLHKVLLIALKVIPMVTALSYLLNTLVSYFGMSAGILSHIFGMSLLPWIFIYISAVVFKFCIYHKMFLYYVLVTDILNIIDYYIGIPISDFKLLMIHIIITGIFLFLILYLYVKYNKKPVE